MIYATLYFISHANSSIPLTLKRNLWYKFNINSLVGAESVTFKPGNNANPGGRPKSKLMTDALRHLIMQPCGKKGTIGRPRKMTGVQAIVLRMINDAIDGDSVAANAIFNRLDGTIVKEEGSPWDVPPPQDRDITLKEAARRIGFLLLSQQPEDDAQVIEN